MRSLAFLIALSGCSASEPFTVNPTPLEFGEVDFQPELPATGHSPIDFTIENTGSRPLDITFPVFPEERLQLNALLASDAPPTLATLEPGESQTVVMGVIGYELGERDTLVLTSFTVAAGETRVIVPASYLPVRDIEGGDSGL